MVPLFLSRNTASYENPVSIFRTVNSLKQTRKPLLLKRFALIWVNKKHLKLNIDTPKTEYLSFFLTRFSVCFKIFMILFLVTPCPIVAVQLWMEWIPIFYLKKMRNGSFIRKKWSPKIKLIENSNLTFNNKVQVYFVIVGN